MMAGFDCAACVLFERMDDAVFDIDDTCGHFSGQRCQLILCRMRMCVVYYDTHTDCAVPSYQLILNGVLRSALAGMLRCQHLARVG